MRETSPNPCHSFSNLSGNGSNAVMRIFITVFVGILLVGCINGIRSAHYNAMNGIGSSLPEIVKKHAKGRVLFLIGRIEGMGSIFLLRVCVGVSILITIIVSFTTKLIHQE